MEKIDQIEKEGNNELLIIIMINNNSHHEVKDCSIRKCSWSCKTCALQKTGVQKAESCKKILLKKKWMIAVGFRFLSTRLKPPSARACRSSNRQSCQGAVYVPSAWCRRYWAERWVRHSVPCSRVSPAVRMSLPLRQQHCPAWPRPPLRRWCWPARRGEL
jgi:hypothetical protein